MKPLSIALLKLGLYLSSVYGLPAQAQIAPPTNHQFGQKWCGQQKVNPTNPKPQIRSLCLVREYDTGKVTFYSVKKTDESIQSYKIVENGYSYERSAQPSTSIYSLLSRHLVQNTDKSEMDGPLVMLHVQLKNSDGTPMAVFGVIPQQQVVNITGFRQIKN